MINIAICDDDLYLCNWMENVIFDYAKSTGVVYEVEIFTKGEEVCKYLDQGNYLDIVFLDIELGLMSGVEIGKRIREVLQNDTLQIVYISSKSTYAMDLFEVRPLHFLIKPLDKCKLIGVIGRGVELLNKQSKIFEYKIKRIKNRLPAKNIAYFEGKNRQVLIHKGNEVEIFYGTLKEVYKQVQTQDFFFCHNSFLVNYHHISMVEFDNLTMDNKEILTISQSKRKEVKEIIAQMGLRYL